ncbi:MAG TPA: sulfatase-like hydrolase/transferase, partial [Chloroflexota bacterium]|nr:sulfatase-like hydrolase/transferase [Chloroflexota bacterium]
MSNSTGKPNFLIIITDQHDPLRSATYGHPRIKTPSMDRLASEGITFRNAYCNTPLCAPGRFSFMTGRYVHHLGTWDNATPQPSDAVTWAHRLRAIGYDAVLSGKMHFLGPDKLHGFRAQLATDLHGNQRHPIFAWDEGDGPTCPPRPWQHPTETGVGRTSSTDADDQAEAAALAYLQDPARRGQPWALCVGFIAPHDPWIVPEPYFSMYYPDVEMPNLPAGHLENLPPAAKVLRERHRMEGPFTEEQIRRTRAAYFGMVTRVDEQIGRLLTCLDEQGLADDTVVIHTSDHGEMLGEHGLWRKSNFYDQSARVPLQIRLPGREHAGRRVEENVSLVDVTATILDLAGLPTDTDPDARLDGVSLRASLDGERPWSDEIFCEYLAHGNDRPRAMVRRSHWKLCYG